MSIFYIQEPELAAKVVDEENEMSVGSSRTSIGKSDVLAKKP
jgi:hypothetical protein